MKWVALILGLASLAVALYGATGPFVRYQLANRRWLESSSSARSGGMYEDRAAERRRHDQDMEFRQAERNECQQVVMAALPAAVLGLILGIVALRKKGGGVAIGGIVLSLAGAGAVGYMLAGGVF